MNASTTGAALTTRRLLGRSFAGLRSAPYLRRWIILGAGIGVIAGLGAVAFISALHLGTHLLLGVVGGYTPATTAGEGGIHAASIFHRPWAIPLVAGAGGLVSALLVFGLAPEAEGHGTDAAIAAVHHHPTSMRPRATIVKFFASALTIGSGGSGGREGPTAQISASFGSIVARVLKLSPADARIAVSAGIASGIGAIFRAPLGGAVLGAELPYRDDIETQALVPSLVASIVAFAVFGSFEGFTPIFGDQTGYQFTDVRDLMFFALLGLAAGGVGRLYAWAFYRLSALQARLRLPRMVKPALAGLVVGAIGLAIPGVLGTGYGTVQQAMLRPALLGMPLWVVLALPFAKILATGLSIGSGGSGGIFGPGMVIGGFTGAALWRLLELTTPGMPTSPMPFVIVGMIACFGSIAHAPLAVMLMVGEMTGNLTLLAPAMVAVACAVLVVGDETIYRSQLPNRAALPAHRLSFGLPMAAAVPVRTVMAAPRLVLPAGVPAARAREQMLEAGVPGAPVVADDGTFSGVVRLADACADGVDPAARVGRLADRDALIVAVDATLDTALDAVVLSADGWVPVLDDDMAVAGIVAVADLVRGYRLGLHDATSRFSRSSRGTALLEREVGAGAPADGRAIAELGLTHSTIVLTILRSGALLFAAPDTVVRAGDRLSIVAGPDAEPRLDSLFATPSEPGPSEPGPSEPTPSEPGPDGAGPGEAGPDEVSAARPPTPDHPGSPGTPPA